MKNVIWVEKYRPKKLDDYIGSAQIKDSIRELIKEPKAMPNFLFISKSPGTGKTSLAYVIKNEIGCANGDFLILNSSDERKIETIRGRVKDFALTMSSREGVPRIVLMDEFDGLLGASQDALRFIMEKYSSNCKFILTANDETKIIEPILSRCVVIPIREIPREDIKNRLYRIASDEKFAKLDGGAIDKLIEVFYPDIRSMINKMQECYPDLAIDKIKTREALEMEVYDLLKARKPFDARKMVIQQGMDSEDLLKFMWQRMLNDEDLKQLPTYKKGVKSMIWYTAEYTAPNMRFGADKDIVLLGWMLRFMDAFKDKVEVTLADIAEKLDKINQAIININKV